MGIAKAKIMEAMEAEERGWSEPEGYVCPDCVKDAFLKEVIRKNACNRKCDYCGRRTRAHSAAPVAVLMEPIGNAVFNYFSDPDDAIMPWDNEEDDWLFGSTSTEDVLMSLSLDCDDQLFQDIANAFVHNEWVETAGGIWTGSHPHELLRDAWSHFVRIVKHEVRYFFMHSRLNTIDQEYAPPNPLPIIESLVKRLDLIDPLPIGTQLFRARIKYDNFPLDVDQLGAPPPEKASAGRMNPAGISYLYLAFEEKTALAEINCKVSDQVAIGQFNAIRDLRILNLTKLPDLPSIFDDNRRDEQEALIFLENFIEEITKPVTKNGSEHIEYVPSQVVSEYFALVFQSDKGEHLDGILYPSSVHSGGRNLVLFPTERGYKSDFNQVEFIDAWMAWLSGSK